MKKPFISVIVPTFNRKHLCKRAVSSVLNQTYQDFELIVVDDGSTDGTTPEFLFGDKSSSQCTYIALPYNTGVSHARNHGVMHARGIWIAFLDSDDVWHPRKLETQTAWTASYPEYAIVQTREVWIRKGVRVNPPQTHEKVQGYIFKECLERCMITPSSVIMKKDLFLTAGKFNESIPACEDYDLWLRIILRHPVGLVDEHLLTRYGGRKDQLSASVGSLDRFRVRSLMQLLEHEHPSLAQKQLIYTTLVKKASIVANGAKKRNKVDLYERFRTIADHYRKLI